MEFPLAVMIGELTITCLLVVWFAWKADQRLDRLLKEHEDSHAKQMGLLVTLKDNAIKQTLILERIERKTVNGK